MLERGGLHSGAERAILAVHATGTYVLYTWRRSVLKGVADHQQVPDMARQELASSGASRKGRRCRGCRAHRRCKLHVSTQFTSSISHSLIQPAGSSATARASTPVPTEAASAESIAADEALLQQFATAVTDIRAVEAQITKLWREELSAMLPDAPEDDQSVAPKGVSPLQHYATCMY